MVLSGQSQLHAFGKPTAHMYKTQVAKCPHAWRFYYYVVETKMWKIVKFEGACLRK